MSDKPVSWQIKREKLERKEELKLSDYKLLLFFDTDSFPSFRKSEVNQSKSGSFIGEKQRQKQNKSHDGTNCKVNAVI